MQEIVAKQRQFFASKATLDVKYRIKYLKALHSSIQSREADIAAALKSDLGKSYEEAFMCEIGLTLSELTYQLKHIHKWTKPKRHSTNLVNFGGTSYTVHDPYGVVLIMAPWNYPFMLSMDPLVGAIAAGNTCVLKPSAYAPATSQIMADIIAEVFPPEYVAVVQGGREQNAALLEQRFDYIFFTGGVSVGKLVMEKAAAHLTPVTLELGGKSPCIVEESADVAMAARRIAFGKFINCGQTCVAPDYVLIHESLLDKFTICMAREIEKMYGSNPLSNPSYGKIVNAKHFERLVGLLTSGPLVYGGRHKEETLQIEPSVLTHVDPQSPIMQEEIFGPILPVLTYQNFDEVIDFVLSREKPLASYLFTRKRSIMKRWQKEISFGGGCINDTIMHLTTTEMGFGGVGHSGMGSYHGRKSFETFTHEKSILKKSPLVDMPMRYQPYPKYLLTILKKILR